MDNYQEKFSEILNESIILPEGKFTETSIFKSVLPDFNKFIQKLEMVREKTYANFSALNVSVDNIIKDPSIVGKLIISRNSYSQLTQSQLDLIESSEIQDVMQAFARSISYLKGAFENKKEQSKDNASLQNAIDKIINGIDEASVKINTLIIGKNDACLRAVATIPQLINTSQDLIVNLKEVIEPILTISQNQEVMEKYISKKVESYMDSEEVMEDIAQNVVSMDEEQQKEYIRKLRNNKEQEERELLDDKLTKIKKYSELIESCESEIISFELSIDEINFQANLIKESVSEDSEIYKVSDSFNRQINGYKVMIEADEFLVKSDLNELMS